MWWDEVGEFVFFGCDDEQLKVWGQCIELGEIEVCFVVQLGVCEVVVVFVEVCFVGFVVVENGSEGLCEVFVEVFIDVMVLQVVIDVEEFLKLLNGKVD